MSNGLYSGVSGLALGVGLYKDVSGLWSGANGLIAGFGGDGSTLSLNFINAVYEAAMTAYNFQQLINFTRTSSATFVGSNGLIQNTPQSVNLLTFTQQFDNAAWTRSNVTATANVVTAPDGTLTADKLEVATTAGAQMYQTLTTLGSGSYTYSIYAKQGSGVADSNVFGVRNNTTATNPALLSIDYSTGVVTQTFGTGATATNVGDGWWRIIIPFTLVATVGDNIRFYAGNSGAAETAGEFCYVWGAQTETGSTATTYTRNVGGLFPPRFDYDPITLQPRGLLIEEQRTNLLLNSRIDGTSLATQNVTVAAVAHTFSFYGTGTVTLSGAHTAVIVGAGAYPARTTLTFTPSAGTLTVTVAGTVQFANLEAGAFATSYIPTVASQVTRTADQASIAAPMFAPWYNQTEGAFVASFDMAGGSAASAFLRAVLSARESATSSNNIYNGSGQVTGWTVLGGVDQAFLTTGAVAADTVTGIAYAYKDNDFAASRNGGTVVTDTSGALPSPTILGIGGNTAGSLFLSGHIRSIKYYPTRLSNAQLQALST